MGRHFSYSALGRVFAGRAAQPEVDEAVPHLAHCRPCWDLAAKAIAELKRENLLARPSDARGAVLTLLEEEERQALDRLRARAGWAELKELAGKEQLDHLKSLPSLQTREMCDIFIEEASRLAQDDPYLGEEAAFVAHALAGILPESRFSEPFRNDLQSEAMLVIANCRRLAADWRGSATALHAARAHLERGTGEPVRRARFLSIQASLASDTGHLEQALDALAQATRIYHREQDIASVATIKVQEANTLLAACRHEEAVACAAEALRLLTPREARLQMLAKSIITESLVFLGRSSEALCSLVATQPLYEQIWGPRTELQLGYLEALLLDSLGHALESEKLYRNVIAGYMEAEHYKEVFRILLTLFESLFRRGALGRAARVCEEALEMLEETGARCHSQLIGLWRDLLTLVTARHLTEHQLLEARQYLARHWNTPARRAPLGPGESTNLTAHPRKDLNGDVAPAAEELRRVVDGTQDGRLSASPPGVLSGCLYEEALERYDRELIATVLTQCGGRVRETSRRLDISRNTLREKMKKYGLRAEDQEHLAAEQRTGSCRPRDEELQPLVANLRARAWWAELRRLPPGRQIDRIKGVASLQTQEIFDRLAEEAARIAQNDPPRGEETACVAYALASMLPRSRSSEQLRNDLQSEAMGIVANCRRLAGNWQGSAAALDVARGHLRRGSGRPAREARLFSIQASLAMDTGHLEQALAWLAQAAAIYRRAQDSAGVASINIQEANTLLAACRYEEAIARAEDALRLLTPQEARLEMLARSIVTESLAALGCSSEALRSFLTTRPLYDQFGERRAQLMVGYLEARLLDCMGYSGESEVYYRAVVAGYMETEQYKEAFRIILTLFESLFRQGALDRAARACEDAIEMLEQAGTDYHSQMKEVWRNLLTLVHARRLTERELLAARHAIARSGKPPGQGTYLEWSADRIEANLGGSEPSRGDLTEGAMAQPRSVAPEAEERRLLTVTPPDPAASLAEQGYRAALERYDRQLIAEGLAQGGGQIAESARLLGIPRTTLRTKIKRYGLTGAGSTVLSARRGKSRL